MTEHTDGAKSSLKHANPQQMSSQDPMYGIQIRVQAARALLLTRQASSPTPNFAKSVTNVGRRYTAHLLVLSLEPHVSHTYRATWAIMTRLQ